MVSGAPCSLGAVSLTPAPTGNGGQSVCSKDGAGGGRPAIVWAPLKGHRQPDPPPTHCRHSVNTVSLLSLLSHVTCLPLAPSSDPCPHFLGVAFLKFFFHCLNSVFFLALFFMTFSNNSRRMKKSSQGLPTTTPPCHVSRQQ